MFNASLLKPYHPWDPKLSPSAHPQPPPAFSDNTGDYFEIEHIVTKSRSGSEPVYTVKWQGSATTGMTISCTRSSLASLAALLLLPPGKAAKLPSLPPLPRTAQLASLLL